METDVKGEFGVGRLRTCWKVPVEFVVNKTLQKRPQVYFFILFYTVYETVCETPVLPSYLLPLD